MGADVRPGGRQWRVQFMRAEDVDDGFQSRPGPFSALGSPLRAGLQVVRDAERYAAGVVGVEAVARFTVRHSPFTAQITHKDRLVCEGRTYGIVGIKELGRHVGFEITASEVHE
ncbi:head-tail adaptor protein [Paracoccus sp. (in: a-proteobacteria)]|uniref:head-tail adaptor protein n=1 Tax=Paracoccus sp. TaxID=267 RepID=UPI0028A012FD|nr:head-tail adaptor protein [Paracoccus sp. (in: a-proteobacteria)]